MTIARTHKQQSPTLIEEMALFEQGYSFIAGLDEAGRGCLAGPVVAAAVILPLTDQAATLEHFAGVNDSKQLTATARERLYAVVMQHALAVGVGIGSAELIDERNILQATKIAMCDALTQLVSAPQALLLERVTTSHYFTAPTFDYQGR